MSIKWRCATSYDKKIVFSVNRPFCKTFCFHFFSSSLEQASRDENVNEFLKLCANADRQQQSRMKLLFEKKNQKSAQSIAQLQRKLEDYQKKLRNLEERGFQQKPTQKMKDKVQVSR
jgi:predicted transcriptional regulator